ncbi:hypothetical protein KP509_11G052600 [Ceratopteris richardii]|uniref:Protein EARLY FLOWERING 4 domain-containing protein n=1 Tax=Ceratopteris richardii TaxID=49495 RepID=A0A8T2TY62_CERRI|nr:hypothetical protein KP509_11G052600 [Ceratopteris richardii]
MEDIMTRENVSSELANGSNEAERVWETFQKRFSQVQVILDKNRLLIKQISQNHESRTPEDLAKNVKLIRELNTNIAQVVEIYASLSSEFVMFMSENVTERNSTSFMRVDTEDSNNQPISGQKKPRQS